MQFLSKKDIDLGVKALRKENQMYTDTRLAIKMLEHMVSLIISKRNLEVLFKFTFKLSTKIKDFLLKKSINVLRSYKDRLVSLTIHNSIIVLPSNDRRYFDLKYKNPNGVVSNLPWYAYYDLSQELGYLLK